MEYLGRTHLPSALVKPLTYRDLKWLVHVMVSTGIGQLDAMSVFYVAQRFVLAERDADINGTSRVEAVRPWEDYLTFKPWRSRARLELFRSAISRGDSSPIPPLTDPKPDEVIQSRLALMGMVYCKLMVRFISGTNIPELLPHQVVHLFGGQPSQVALRYQSEPKGPIQIFRWTWPELPELQPDERALLDTVYVIYETRSLLEPYA